MRPSDLSLSIAVAAVALLLCAGAQEQPAGKALPHRSTKKAIHTPVPAKPKITPQQERGLRMLEATRAEAAALEPEMRTYVLWQISRGYQKIDLAKEDSTLKDAFQTSLSIESQHGDPQECRMPETCDLKSTLQIGILGEILRRSPEALQPILSKAEPDVRKDMTVELLGHYAQHKEFDRAEELLNQFADNDTYPYDIAGELMLLLPEERDSDRLAIFSQALNNYQQHEVNVTPHYQDFATMIVRFGPRLPPALVLEAIDAILEKAKDKDNPATQMRVGISTEGGDAYFGSTYEYRLFELIPVIEQLDKSKAERLLRESSDVRSTLGRYPKGLQSLTPSDYSDKPPAKGRNSGIRSMGFTTGDNPTEAAINQARMRQEDDNNRRLREIAAESAKDPKQALADAMNLPQAGSWGADSSPRVMGLQEVATNSAAIGNATVAKNALDEERKWLDGLSVENQSYALVDAAETYIRLSDPDRAQKTLKEALKIAEKLYARDTDADDPNKAFKGVWPSTNLWRRIVVAAVGISPDFAEEVIAATPDPDIGTLAKLDYAESLIGVPLGSHSEIEWHKDGVKGASKAN